MTIATRLACATRTTGWAILAATTLIAGCAPSSSGDLNAPSSEPTLAEQAEAVRQGQSTEIRLAHALVRDADLSALDGLEDNLTRVNFSRTQITDSGFERLCRFPNLEQLRLASSRVTDSGLASLAQLKKLRHLHLIDMPITDAGLVHLHALTTLESLYLDDIHATEDAVARLAEALPGVHLHVDGHHPPGG